MSKKWECEDRGTCRHTDLEHVLIRQRDAQGEALDKINEQCEAIKRYAHEGDKVICGVGHIQKAIAVARAESREAAAPLEVIVVSSCCKATMVNPNWCDCCDRPCKNYAMSGAELIEWRKRPL